MTIATSSAAAFEGAEQDDAEVIRQVLQGNTAMFELLMRRYNERPRAELSPHVGTIPLCATPVSRPCR